ncbi:MAG: S8 family peptidase [Gaiellaceae bacterium]
MNRLRLALPAAVAAALVAASSAAAFTPSNPYYPKQWYLDQDHAFDAWAVPPTPLQGVKVAIVDSGVDCSLPDFHGQIADWKSFVGGSACLDTEGHGTIVAGEIAGALNSGGIVGLAYSAELLVAKVVAPDGTIPLQAEAAGITWAVNHGARVVNLSFGAVRDPLNPALDTFSKVEAQAIRYAVSKGVVVVAAAGNADEAYTTPWPYASWPAALPHVIGVAALTHSGDVPDFSDRDPTYVDIAAPGVDIFSTFPKVLTSAQQGCTPQGYTGCATGDYRRPEGTSFAAPQVSAAAAVLLGLVPTLTGNQVATILERHADDVDAASGCAACPVGRDKFSGWGSLDVKGAVAAVSSDAALPAADRSEPNDDVSQAKTLWGRKPAVAAALDYWDDPRDVYRVKLARGQRLQARAQARWPRAAVDLTVWRPGTHTVHRGRRLSVAHSARPGKARHLSYRARTGGWYYVEVRVTRPGGGQYALRLTKTS